jgi:transposase InsO family protein
VSKARLIITAVVVEGRSQAQVARDYQASEAWVSRLVARYRTEGEAAFEPRSRRPRTRPGQTPATTVELVLELRRTLTRQGLDAGPVTIAWHLEHHHQIRLSRATIYRILRRADLVTPEPRKKPRSSYARFQAEQPNETWQSDVTHWRLANGVDVEIITWLDDHARYALSVTAHLRVTGQSVVTTFRNATEVHGIPFSTLTDNGLVFTTRFAQGGLTSRNAFETELVRLRVRQKNSRPNHPTTCGKVERFQQTMKRWLRAQPAAGSLDALQQLLDRFVDDYNHRRPHRSLPHHSTPATAYTARPKAGPDSDPAADYRVRHDRVDRAGKVTLRHNGKLFHNGIGRTLAGAQIILLVHDLDIRVIHAATGEIIRQLTLDTTRAYQPTGAKQGGPKRPYGPYRPRKNKKPEP